jgi:hypothetical protein
MKWKALAFATIASRTSLTPSVERWNAGPCRSGGALAFGRRSRFRLKRSGTIPEFSAPSLRAALRLPEKVSALADALLPLGVHVRHEVPSGRFCTGYARHPRTFRPGWARWQRGSPPVVKMPDCGPAPPLVERETRNVARWLPLVLLGAVLAGCNAAEVRAPAWHDNDAMPVWRRAAPDALTPPPRQPVPADSNRA